ncbi:MAG: OpgC domain-containing protein, partial [Candidatus Saccharimonadales bacterium]
MPTAKRRIYELDLLRGFFICVIILDHLQFWPSPFQYLTGQGRLWVSAAEGFFLISGLLVGYLRAYKGSKTPLSTLSKGLLSRALTLYIWCAGITLLVTALAVLLPASYLMPKYPEYHFVTSLPVYLWSVFSGQYASDWIYFLRLYAILLAITPVFLYLIRKGYWVIAALLSVSSYTVSLYFGWEEAALQWQIFFFGAALIGWKLESILAWLRNHLVFRTSLISSLIVITLSTMVLSYFFVHGWGYVES